MYKTSNTIVRSTEQPRTSRLSRHERERAYQGRDASYDGVFVLAVRTTGVFCRPSCPARKPRPEHVRFFATPTEALQAGFRPCRRCQPCVTDGRMPEWVNRLLEPGASTDGRVRDVDLKARGIDPARARRFFKRRYGMTFQAYRRAWRMSAALQALRAGEDLTMVGLDLGYASTSGFRDAFVQTFGEPPGQSRTADCLVVQTMPSPIGPLTLGATSRAVRVLEFVDRDGPPSLERLRRSLGSPVLPGTNELLSQLRTELEQYFAGTRREFNVPVEYRGTAFQCRTWDALRTIPYGATISYEALAGRVGRPSGQRAVGSANGRNPVSIVVPCHRVVNKSGQLGGYGGGLWRKQFLLDHERRVCALLPNRGLA
jgi:AraC family transcriptional regulator of adaptative response/methylated-DNA-[protein]-cysteine methyltransferase